MGACDEQVRNQARTVGGQAALVTRATPENVKAGHQIQTRIWRWCRQATGRHCHQEEALEAGFELLILPPPVWELTSWLLFLSLLSTSEPLLSHC